MAGIQHTPQTFEENAEVQEAFLAGQCDAWTSDRSQLAGIRSNWPADQGGPQSLTILDETFSKEPLGPAVVDGDSEWFDVVNWVVLATIEAEELGITADNLDQMLESEDPGGAPVPGPAGRGRGRGGGGRLRPRLRARRSTVDVIRAVGNYGEIYDRPRRAGHRAPDRARGHGERPVDRGRAALLTTVPLIGGH